jgi:hypothetical protein
MQSLQRVNTTNCTKVFKMWLMATPFIENIKLKFYRYGLVCGFNIGYVDFLYILQGFKPQFRFIGAN